MCKKSHVSITGEALAAPPATRKRKTFRRKRSLARNNFAKETIFIEVTITEKKSSNFYPKNYHPTSLATLTVVSHAVLRRAAVQFAGAPDIPARVVVELLPSMGPLNAGAPTPSANDEGRRRQLMYRARLRSCGINIRTPPALRLLFHLITVVIVERLVAASAPSLLRLRFVVVPLAAPPLPGAPVAAEHLPWLHRL
ncbi:hypothetical protein EVAR_10013_1 [Eumeta japonica]|uniref:Uncharacterized protein n=1 Tax=Eumeta variegata TaxID=151549 RepID=A0A4C1TR18_EUMVA|nr:hypothetical protein EVAR_10013_1 [Eumeta japonica]